MLLLPAVAWLLAPRPVIASRSAPHVAETGWAPAPPPDETAPHPRRVDRPVRPAASVSAEPSGDGEVTGLVLDPDGKPVAGAFVGCDDRDQALATTTDDDGRFRLAPEASGCLAVAHLPSFVPSERAPIVAGRDNVLRLGRAGGIEGDVVDEVGAPVTAFQLGVETYQGPDLDSAPMGQTKSFRDPRGAFLWSGLPPGAYVLTASAEGRPPARSGSVDVETGRTAHHVRIVLPRGGTLAGRVVDAETRRPIAGALIGLDTATMTGADNTRPTRSDEGGAYVLEGAPAGPFSVRVSRDGYMNKVIAGLTTRGGVTTQQDIQLRPLVDGGPRDEFAGIGAVLGPSGGGVTISTVFPGGGAAQAGLHPGDRFKRIDGVDASGMPLADCVQRLRGPDGSVVSVQVDRGGQIVDVNVVRHAYTR